MIRRVPAFKRLSRAPFVLGTGSGLALEFSTSATIVRIAIVEQGEIVEQPSGIVKCVVVCDLARKSVQSVVAKKSCVAVLCFGGSDGKVGKFGWESALTYNPLWRQGTTIAERSLDRDSRTYLSPSCVYQGAGIDVAS